MAQCTQLCTTKKLFATNQNIFWGITLFDTFSLIACNRVLIVVYLKGYRGAYGGGGTGGPERVG